MIFRFLPFRERPNKKATMAASPSGSSQSLPSFSPFPTSIPISYLDETGIWSYFSQQLSSRLPLPGVKIPHPRASGQDLNLRPLPLTFEAERRDLASSQSSSSHGAPASVHHGVNAWHRRPYAHVFLLVCEDADIYKATVKARLKEWADSLLREDNWLILYLPKGYTEGLSKQQKKVVERVRADFGKAGRVVVLAMNEPSRAKLQEGWEDFFTALRDVLRVGYERRCLDLAEEAARLEATRALPQWNYWNYYIAKEGLALVYELFQVPEEALRVYGDLWQVFQATYFVADGADTLLPRFGGRDQGDELGGFLDVTRKPYRDRIYQSATTEFDFREYHHGRVVSLLLAVDEVDGLAERVQGFASEMAGRMGSLKVGCDPGYIAAWVFSTLRSSAAALEAKLAGLVVAEGKEPHKVALACQIGELYLHARGRLEALGAERGLITPARFKNSVEYYYSAEAHTRALAQAKERADVAAAAVLAVVAAASDEEDGSYTPGSLQRPGPKRKLSYASVAPSVASTAADPSSAAAAQAAAQAASLSSLAVVAKERRESHSWVEPLYLHATATPADEAEDSRLRPVEDIPAGCAALREALARVPAFEALFVELTGAAARNFSLSYRNRSVVRLNAEVASILFFRRKYREAEPLLKNLCTMYRTDGWDDLVYAVQVKLAECQRLLGSTADYLGTCLQLLASKAERPAEERNFYLDEVLGVAATLPDIARSFLEPLLVASLDVTAPRTFSLGQKIRIVCTVVSTLPKPVVFDKLSLRLIHVSKALRDKALIFEVRGLTLNPGPNEIVFVERAVHLGQFTVEKLWGELGKVLLVENLRHRYVKHLITVEESRSSIKVVVDHSAWCQVVGHPHVLIARLHTNTDTIDSGTMRVSSSSGLIVEGPETVEIPPSQEDEVLEFPIQVRAAERTSTLHDLTFLVQYTKTTQEAFQYSTLVEVACVQPMEPTVLWEDLGGGRLLAQVLVRYSAPLQATVRSFELSGYKVLRGSEPASVAGLVLRPDQVLSFWFEVEKRRPGSPDKPAFFLSYVFVDAGATSEPYSYSVHLDADEALGPDPAVTALLASPARGVVGEPMRATVTCTAPAGAGAGAGAEHRGPFFVQVQADPLAWVVAGPVSKLLHIEDVLAKGAVSFDITLTPLQAGVVLAPSLKLKTAVQELIPFLHVARPTGAGQVTVRPQPAQTLCVE
jgi:hypothetical protein